ncbi:hypothetical protein [Demequina litorisediminis]|uniref:Uncharacterized protein n=1 Tax=Demequina litorisediminis TaxID=1849022 RepID=A0ABQ6IM40_9MICO|nr:hypothetical protein [Demequina litorisediminis]GMA37822.1 hypothetical protein GCM10025876_40260 [Demequina litorisediminis]
MSTTRQWRSKLADRIEDGQAEPISAREEELVVELIRTFKVKHGRKPGERVATKSGSHRLIDRDSSESQQSAG